MAFLHDVVCLGNETHLSLGSTVFFFSEPIAYFPQTGMLKGRAFMDGKRTVGTRQLRERHTVARGSLG